MKSAQRFTVLLTLVAAASAGVVPVAYSKDAPLGQADKASIPPLIQQMAGTWDVRQRMWPGPGTDAIQLPPAVAHRSLVGNRIVKEVMTPAPGSKQAPFTRAAFFNYNAVNRQYEYFSIDTRAPQMMMEKSYATDAAHQLRDKGVLVLYGSTFVAPKWGNTVNARFRYRLEIGEIKNNNRQVVRLYLTPLSRDDAGEFLAFQYIYTRQR